MQNINDMNLTNVKQRNDKKEFEGGGQQKNSMYINFLIFLSGKYTA